MHYQEGVKDAGFVSLTNSACRRSLTSSTEERVRFSFCWVCYLVNIGDAEHRGPLGIMSGVHALTAPVQ